VSDRIRICSRTEPTKYLNTFLSTHHKCTRNKERKFTRKGKRKRGSTSRLSLKWLTESASADYADKVLEYSCIINLLVTIENSQESLLERKRERERERESMTIKPEEDLLADSRTRIRVSRKRKTLGYYVGVAISEIQEHAHISWCAPAIIPCCTCKSPAAQGAEQHTTERGTSRRCN